MGTNWLRVAAWLVAVASLVGNVAVVTVLIGTSRCPMAVSKFLMINLAIADFCMGLYLFLIVGMDVNTIGVYFNYAIDWQNGWHLKLTDGGPTINRTVIGNLRSAELIRLILDVITAAGALMNNNFGSCKCKRRRRARHKLTLRALPLQCTLTGSEKTD